MVLRLVAAGLALSGAVLATGCACHKQTCGSPAIVSSAPAPCCGGAPGVPGQPVPVTGPTGPVYSSPVPLIPSGSGH